MVKFFLFNQNGDSTSNGLRKMIRKYYETGTFSVRLGRGRKPVCSELISDVTLLVDEYQELKLKRVARAFAIMQKL